MSITLAQAVENAIAAEHAAEQFYLHLAQQCADENGRAILCNLAAQEREHAASLESMAARLVAGKLPERADELVRGIETAPAAASAAGLALVDALELALEAENSAILYYDALATTSTGDASQFFARVGKEEEAHAVAVRALLEQATRSLSRDRVDPLQ
jgi:rubrerythrin